MTLIPVEKKPFVKIPGNPHDWASSPHWARPPFWGSRRRPAGPINGRSCVWGAYRNSSGWRAGYRSTFV